MDTPESVILRLVDQELERSPGVRPRSAEITPSAIRLESDRPESLTHSRVLYAVVDGKEVDRPNWNNILDRLHVIGRTRLGSFDELKRATRARIRDGKYEKDGFHYVSEIGLSIQGTDSNTAWDYSLRLARELRVRVHIRFEWRDKQGAAHPGQTGILEWSPTNLAVA